MVAFLIADGITGEEKIKEFKLYYDKILLDAKEKLVGEDELYHKHQALFKLLHEGYLNKYVTEAYFSRLFKKGEFNCVTAVALYYLICTNLGLSISLYESPYHVYAMAKNSRGKEFTIELTDPLEGFDSGKDDNKEEYMDYLLEQKLITQEEIDTKGLEDLYKDFITESHLIDSKTLISIYYANLASYQSNKRNSYNAYTLLKKAVLINADSIRIVLHNMYG